MLQQNEYAVRVKRCPLWQDHSSVTFGMCMGNPNWEGPKFVALLEWASRHFSHINIALSDTLGRHNHTMLGVSSVKSMELAKKQGDLWLREHTPYLQQCETSYEVFRWDQWLAHPDFMNTQTRYDHLAKNSQPFSAMIARAIEEYLERYHRKGISLPTDAHLHCYNYLIEELAGTTLRAKTFGRSCRVYPSLEPEWLAFVRNHSISEFPMGLEQEYYVAVDFRKRTSALVLDHTQTATNHLAA